MLGLYLSVCGRQEGNDPLGSVAEPAWEQRRVHPISQEPEWEYVGDRHGQELDRQDMPLWAKCLIQPLSSWWGAGALESSVPLMAAWSPGSDRAAWGRETGLLGLVWYPSSGCRVPGGW